MTIVNDFELIKNAVAELNKSNAGLQEALTVWSESITNIHRAELNVRAAHRGVLKAQNMLTLAINNNLGEELERMRRHES